MIKFERLSLQYDDKVLFQNFSTVIERGEKVCITGPSGCGKSSILSAILGFITPTSGEIFIEGNLLNSLSITKLREQIAYLPQDFSFPYLTVEELMKAPFQFKANKGKQHAQMDIFAKFDQLGLEHSVLHQNLSEISGGQKQRVMLALVGLLNKPILLLDEPTSALDSLSVSLVADYLLAMKQTVVIVTHDTQFAAHFDRTISFENL